jgi:hypothetical protein
MSHARIGEMLLQAGLITAEELEEALTAQQIYGGRLGTVLIEHDFVDEDELAEVLAVQHGMRRISREHLADIPARVIAAVPASVATRFSVVPFSYDEQRGLVWLATTDPADLRRQDELRFAIEKKVELALAPEILLRRALEKYYDVAHQRRFITLHSGQKRKKHGRARTATQVILGAPEMLRLIVESRTQGELLDRSLDCLATFAQDVALLTVDQEGLSGWGSRGAIAPAGEIVKAHLPLWQSPLVGQLLAAKKPILLQGDDGAELRALLKAQLNVARGAPVALLPLIVGKRTMGCYVLTSFQEKQRFDPALVGELVQRVAWRMQALHLMDCVNAPLSTA